jgi:hypothetical protein
LACYRVYTELACYKGRYKGILTPYYKAGTAETDLKEIKKRAIGAGSEVE